MSNPFEPPSSQPEWQPSQEAVPPPPPPPPAPVPPPPPAPQMPPPGWYPDPSGMGGTRYWDGAQWTSAAQLPPPPGYAPYPYSGGRAALQRTGVGPVEAVKLAFARWSDYRGRSSRSEYWWFVLFTLIVAIVYGIAVAVLFPGHLTAAGVYQQSSAATALTWLLYIPLVLFGLPLEIRRLHDSGKPWPYLLFGLIPCAGFIVIIVLMCLDTEATPNQWGPPPQ